MIIGVFGLAVYILFFVGLIVKIKRGKEKEKILKQLDEQLEAKYAEKENTSTKDSN